MKAKHILALTFVLIAGCGEQKQEAAIKLVDGSEIKLNAQIIESTRKPSDGGDLVVNKLEFSSSKEVAIAELDSTLSKLDYKKQIISSPSGLKVHYMKNSLPTIGVYFSDSQAAETQGTNGSIYWHEKN